MTSVHLVYWEPVTWAERTVSVHGADAVARLAAKLLRDYQEAGSVLPGLSLQRGPNHWDELSVAVAPEGWALFHLAQDMTPYSTTTPHEPEDACPTEEESLTVLWDQQLTWIPPYAVIPVSMALVGVRQWLEDGTLSPLLSWGYQGE